MLAAASRKPACLTKPDRDWAAMWPDHHRSSPPEIRSRDWFNILLILAFFATLQRPGATGRVVCFGLRTKQEQKSRFEKRNSTLIGVRVMSSRFLGFLRSVDSPESQNGPDIVYPQCLKIDLLAGFQVVTRIFTSLPAFFKSYACYFRGRVHNGIRYGHSCGHAMVKSVTNLHF